MAEAQQQEALLTYKKSIQQAFQEVSDALVGVRRLREVRLEAAKQVQALSQQTDLANQRYFGGVTHYLEVLDSDRQLFEAQLRLTQVQANELLAVVALYRALGGGWQTEETTAPYHAKVYPTKRNYLSIWQIMALIYRCYVLLLWVFGCPATSCCF